MLRKMLETCRLPGVRTWLCCLGFDARKIPKPGLVRGESGDTGSLRYRLGGLDLEDFTSKPSEHPSEESPQIGIPNPVSKKLRMRNPKTELDAMPTEKIEI